MASTRLFSSTKTKHGNSTQAYNTSDPRSVRAAYLERYLVRHVSRVSYNSRSHRAATLGNGVHFMQTFGSRSKFDAENDGAD